MDYTLKTSLSFTVPWSLLKLMSIKSVIPSNHLILCLPRLLLSSIFPSIWVFSNEVGLRIRWSKYWNFSVSPSDEYSGWFPLGWTGLISFQSQGTLKSLLRHHSSKASFYINYLYKVSISNFSNILEIKILKYEWRGTILSMRLLRFVLQIYVFLMCRMLSPYHNSYQSLIPLQNQPWFQNLISVSCKSSAD